MPAVLSLYSRRKQRWCEEERVKQAMRIVTAYNGFLTVAGLGLVEFVTHAATAGYQIKVVRNLANVEPICTL